MTKQILVLVISILALASCESVIDIDLNDGDPQLVIEANLKEGQQEFIVTISQTTSYFDNERPRYLEGAEVVLHNNEGWQTELLPIGEGRYAATVTAESGLTYTLEVVIDDQYYTASTYMPPVVPLVGLEEQYQAPNAFLEEGYLVFCLFDDDPARTNYYRFVHLVDGVLQNNGSDLQVLDDNLFNGAAARVPLLQQIFRPGELVEVRLQHLDQASYAYYKSLSDIVSNRQGPNAGSAAPGNPTTNWKGGALGVFSSYSEASLSIRISD